MWPYLRCCAGRGTGSLAPGLGGKVKEIERVLQNTVQCSIIYIYYIYIYLFELLRCKRMSKICHLSKNSMIAGLLAGLVGIRNFSKVKKKTMLGKKGQHFLPLAAKQGRKNKEKKVIHKRIF